MNKWMWKGGENGIRTHRVVMQDRDVRNYIRSIVFKRELGTYCENCGINLGEGFKSKKLMFNVYHVCEGCHDQLHEELKLGRPLSAPNLNDLIDIGGMDGLGGLQQIPTEKAY